LTYLSTQRAAFYALIHTYNIFKEAVEANNDSSAANSSMLHDGTAVIVHWRNIALGDPVGLLPVPLEYPQVLGKKSFGVWKVQFCWPRGSTTHIDWFKAEPCAPRLDVEMQMMLRIFCKRHVDQVEVMIDFREGEAERDDLDSKFEWKSKFYTCEVDG
jgi:hypothetical protein